ncbi:MAG: hypothetical protein WCW17_03615 [Patescibacteria group bacterium]
MKNDQNNIIKKKIGIYDLTDCEGCELQLLASRSKIEELLKYFDFVNFRLLGTENKNYLDVALIEGTPLTQSDIDLIHNVRKQSKIVIAFGTCAANGGIAAGIDAKERENFAKKIYSTKYASLALVKSRRENQMQTALPLSSYIKVDYIISGCPVEPNVIFDLLMTLYNLGSIENQDFPVCQECKAQGNQCLLKNNEVCFGPIIQAGCGAPCPTAGHGCLGCLGLLKDANIKQFNAKLKKIGLSDARIEQLYNIFLKNRKI